MIRKVQTSNRGANDNADSYQILLPLVQQDSSAVHSALACRVDGDSIYIQLLDGRMYASYNADSASLGINGRQLSLTLMMLDKEVFGHDVFRIVDSSAFGGLGNDVKYVKLSGSSNTNANRMQMYTVEICYTVMLPSNDGQLVGCPPGGPCNQYVEQYMCDSYSGWYDDGDYGGGGGGGGTGGGGDTGGGGGGGGGGWTDPSDPCPQRQALSRAQPISPPCDGGNPGTPTPANSARTIRTYSQ
jgi:uncharacterized membrane protein YgcG